MEVLDGKQNPIDRQQPPKTWLVESILVTFLCCLPFGIVGIVFSSKVETLFYAGDVDGAMRASQDAAKWTKIGFWIGIASSVLVVIYLVIVGVIVSGEF